MSVKTVFDVFDIESTETRRKAFVTVLTVVVVSCWILPIRNPLWRDETGTYWIVKDGIAAVIQRSYYWTNWSPYYLVEWLAVHLGGKNEIVMRVPSVLAMAAAAFFLYRIGAWFWDREAGLLAAIVFAGMPDVAYAAADARPYAFALMALCAYTFALLRWIDSRRLRDLLVAALLAALTAYSHVLLGIGLIVPALYAASHRPKIGDAALALVLTGVLLIPLAIQLRDYVGMNTIHLAPYVPTLDDLWSAIAPPQQWAMYGIGVLVAFFVAPGLSAEWRLSRTSIATLVLWVLLAPTLLFAVARTTEFGVFRAKYLISTTVPAALVFGILIRAVKPAGARFLVIGVVVMMSVTAFTLSAKSFHGEGWRDAMAAIRQQAGERQMAVLTPSPFTEAQRGDLLNDPRLKEVLFAPELFYPPAGRLIHMPYRFDEPYMERVVDVELAGEKEFLLLTSGDGLHQWLMARLSDRAIASTLIGEFRGLRVYRYRLDS